MSGARDETRAAVASEVVVHPLDEHQQTVQAMMAQPLAGSATPVLDASRETELDHLILNAAKRFYASGRTLTTEQLKEVFASMLEEARGMQRRYSGDIAQKARQANVSELLPLN